jgi:hypothetical protein
VSIRGTGPDQKRVRYVAGGCSIPEGGKGQREESTRVMNSASPEKSHSSRGQKLNYFTT